MVTLLSNIQFNTQLTNEINVSPPAIEQFIALTEHEPGISGVRIFVSGGGCSGMKYGMTFVEEAHQYDAILKAEGIDIYVDAITLGFLAGVEIDYKIEGVNKSFVFKNAFAKAGGAATCGSCGAVGGGCGG